MAKRAEVRTQRLIEGKPEQPPIDVTKMTIREYAAEAVRLAYEDLENAASTTQGSPNALEPTFFFLRRLKVHPKLFQAPPAEAAGVVCRLFDALEEVDDLAERDGLNRDALHTYVMSRWESIRFLPGQNPWEVAIGLVKNGYKIQYPTAMNIVWIQNPLVTVAEKARFMADGYLPRKYVTTQDHAEQRGSLDRTKLDKNRYSGDELIDTWCEGMADATFHPHEVGDNPSQGVFYLGLLALHDMFTKAADSQEPGTSRSVPELLIGTDDVGKKIGVAGQTVWRWREDLINSGMLGVTRPGRGNNATLCRLSVRYFIHFLWMQRHTKAGRKASENAISID